MQFNLARINKKMEELLDNAKQQLLLIEDKTDLECNLAAFDEIMLDPERKLKVVFIGQYSAGKSSIIKMLTGDKEIKIGAAITTQDSKIYEWQGLEIVDTPGIATGYRTDHDKITYKAIAEADLLVFVITNEGFDATIVENFKKIAYNLESSHNGVSCGQGKLNEMILVVNKMDRMGNTAPNQEILRKDIVKSLPTQEAHELSICFLDAESYLDSLTEEDEECRRELFERSGYEQFIHTLNEFAKEKGFAGKLVSPLQQMEAILQETAYKLKGTTGDPHADAADVVLRKTISELQRNRTRGEQALKEIFSKHAMEIRNLGWELADALGVTSDGNQEAEARRRLEGICNNCSKEVEDKITEINAEIQADMQGILADNFAVQVRQSIPASDQSEGANRARAIFEGLQDFNDNVLKHVDRDTIKAIGKFFGKKFRPWEAVKYAKWLRAVDKYLPIIGQIISLGAEMWDQQKQEEAHQALVNARSEITTTFNGLADQFELNGRRIVQEGFVESMNKLLSEQQAMANELDALKKNKSTYLKEVNTLIKDCRELAGTIRAMCV